MELVAEYMATYIFRKGVIKENDYEIYKYGFQTGLEMLLCLCVGFIIAISLNAIMVFLIFMLIFFPLRIYVGGIHMKHFLTCFLFSGCVLIVGIQISKMQVFSCNVELLLIFFLLFIVEKLAMISTKKMDNEKEAMFYRKQRKKVFAFIGLSSLLFWKFCFNSGLIIVLYVEVVIIVAAILEILQDNLKRK